MNTSTASAGTPMMAHFFIPKGQQLTIAPSLLEPVNFEVFAARVREKARGEFTETQCSGRCGRRISLLRHDLDICWAFIAEQPLAFSPQKSTNDGTVVISPSQHETTIRHARHR